MAVAVVLLTEILHIFSLNRIIQLLLLAQIALFSLANWFMLKFLMIILVFLKVLSLDVMHYLIVVKLRRLKLIYSLVKLFILTHQRFMGQVLAMAVKVSWQTLHYHYVLI